MSQERKRDPIICRCNSITEKTIKRAIIEGADTLDKLFDATNAGVGPCGGTCRNITGPILDYYLKNKEFPPSKK